MKVGFFATEPVSETYPIGGRRKDHISPSVSALGFTARRKAIFVRRMNKTNITCGYSGAINRDVREGVLSLESKIERYRKRRSLSLPRGLGSFIFRAFPASNFASFFEARQKGQKEKNKER